MEQFDIGPQKCVGLTAQCDNCAYTYLSHAHRHADGRRYAGTLEALRQGRCLIGRVGVEYGTAGQNSDPCDSQGAGNKPIINIKAVAAGDVHSAGIVLRKHDHPGNAQQSRSHLSGGGEYRNRLIAVEAFRELRQSHYNAVRVLRRIIAPGIR